MPGLQSLLDYYVASGGLTAAQAAATAASSPEHIAAAFIIFGGATGALLMFVAQSKAQVLNAYSGSLSLANLCDAGFGWRPRWFALVLLANGIAAAMLAGSIIEWFAASLTMVGVLMTACMGVIVADYHVVRRLRPGPDPGGEPEAVNLAGVVAVGASAVLAHYVLIRWNPIEFASALACAVCLYVILRLWVLAPAGESNALRMAA